MDLCFPDYLLFCFCFTIFFLTSATQPIKPTDVPALDERTAVGSGPPRYIGSFRFNPTVLPGDVPAEE